MLICLPVAYDGFLTTTLEVNSSDSDFIAHNTKNVYYLVL